MSRPSVFAAGAVFGEVFRMTPHAPRIVLDFSCKARTRHQRHFSWQAHYLVIMDGGSCSPVQCMCILDFSCVATVKRINTLLRSTG